MEHLENLRASMVVVVNMFQILKFAAIVEKKTLKFAEAAQNREYCEIPQEMYSLGDELRGIV